MIWRDKTYEEMEISHKEAAKKDILLLSILTPIVSFITLFLFWYFYK